MERRSPERRGPRWKIGVVVSEVPTPGKTVACLLEKWTISPPAFGDIDGGFSQIVSPLCPVIGLLFVYLTMKGEGFIFAYEFDSLEDRWIESMGGCALIVYLSGRGRLFVVRRKSILTSEGPLNRLRCERERSSVSSCLTSGRNNDSPDYLLCAPSAKFVRGSCRTEANRASAAA